MPQSSKIWNNFQGGISDSQFSGAENSFFKLFGLNVHDTPGQCTPNQALKKDSGSTITEFCRVSLSLSTGVQLWFSYTSGKIWQRDSAGAWTLANTTTPAAGNAGCLGACEFNGNVYWATQSRLHYVAVANVSNFSGKTENWQTFTNTDANFHPMAVQNNNLFIGDANLIAKVDSSNVFTANALTLEKPHRARCLEVFDIDLIIGTTIASNVNFSKVYRWDTIQTSWQYAEPVQENAVNCFFIVGNTLYAQCGTSGNIYYYDGQFLQRAPLRIPGSWSNTQIAEVYPSAVGIYKNRAIFGLSNSQDTSNTTGNPADEGIYSVGSYDEKYPVVLTGVEFPISTGSVSGIEIGAILVERNVIYVSWYDHAGAGTYGVDTIDFTTKQTGAYLETLVVSPDNDTDTGLTTFSDYFAGIVSLPASTSLTFKYYSNYGSLTTFTNSVVNDTIANGSVQPKMQSYVKEAVDARVMRLRIEFTPNANNAPIIDSVGITSSN